jgi:hypothetical protein
MLGLARPKKSIGAVMGNDRVRLTDESIKRLLRPTAHKRSKLVDVFRFGGV